MEILKQRLVLAGFSGAFAFSLPLVAVAAKVFEHPLRPAVDSALFFWVYVGLPLAACVMGASAGAGLRRTYELEAPLPVSPERRAWAAFGAAAAQLLVLGVLVALSVAALSTAPEQAAAGGMGGRFMRGSILLLSYALLYGQGASFVLASLSGHGVAGGLAGAVLGVCSYAALGAGLMVSEILGVHPGDFPKAWGFLPKAWGTVGLTFAGTAWALGAAVRWAERERRGWGTPVAAAAATVGGVFLAAGLAVSSFKTVMDGLHQFGIVGAPLGSAPPEFTPEARREVFRGLMMASWSGDVVRVLPDGTRQMLFKGDDHSLLDLVKAPLWTRPTNYLWDDDGTLWALVHGDPRQGRDYEVWRGPAEGPLSLAFGVPRDVVPTLLMRGKRGLGLVGVDHEGTRGFSAFTKDGKAAFVRRNGHTALEKQPGAGLKPDVEEFLKKGAYYLMKDGRKGLFSVPSEGRGNIAYLQGGDSYLFVPEKGVGRFKLHALPEGTLAGWRERWSAIRFSPGTGFAAPLDLSAAVGALPERETPRFARWTSESLWLIQGERRLLRLDASSGALKDSWALPSGPKGAELVVTLDGIFCDTGRELYFVGWDGAARRLSLR
ncbi:MAG TPA: hypothetical protein DCM05_08080 [Elusimicrobia bacterium]|nr:hypothetical protein [Elusimicrobiota bacterium]